MCNILKNLCPQIYLHQGSHNCPLYTFRASWAIVKAQLLCPTILLYQGQSINYSDLPEKDCLGDLCKIWFYFSSPLARLLTVVLGGGGIYTSVGEMAMEHIKHVNTQQSHQKWPKLYTHCNVCLLRLISIVHCDNTTALGVMPSKALHCEWQPNTLYSRVQCTTPKKCHDHFNANGLLNICCMLIYFIISFSLSGNDLAVKSVTS